MRVLLVVWLSSMMMFSCGAAWGGSTECEQDPRSQFANPGEEINYFNRYHNCWVENLLLNSKMASESYLGKGLELFSHPEYVEAIGFSKAMCNTDNMGSFRINRRDYPCWFDIATIRDNPSVDEAVRREAPKALFSRLLKGSHNTGDTVEYVLCLNDDPTKKKEYSRSCLHGYTMEITEQGRGDVDGDLFEDVVVRIRYGYNGDNLRKCYVAAFSRRNGAMFKMVRYGPIGQCR